MLNAKGRQDDKKDQKFQKILEDLKPLEFGGKCQNISLDLLNQHFGTLTRQVRLIKFWNMKKIGQKVTEI